MPYHIEITLEAALNVMRKVKSLSYSILWTISVQSFLGGYREVIMESTDRTMIMRFLQIIQ